MIQNTKRVRRRGRLRICLRSSELSVKKAKWTSSKIGIELVLTVFSISGGIFLT
jgi:hypothetical protein